MSGATGRMKDAVACVTLDEAIGTTGQGYQTSCVCVCLEGKHAALECSACVNLKNVLGGSRWDFCVI